MTVGGSSSGHFPLSHAEDLLAYLDGQTAPEVTRHVRTCSDCRAAAAALGRTQHRLVQALYRFDCPTPHALGEYELGVVPGPERVAIARHVLGCAECGTELRTLRAFLATDPPLAADLGTRLRRLMATLVNSPGGARTPALAGLRDAEAAPSTVYRAEDVSVSLIRGLGAHELTGLVARDVTGPDDVAGVGVRLVNAQGAWRVATVGDAGEFGFADLAPGIYDLEVQLEDRVVIIPGVRIDDV